MTWFQGIFLFPFIFWHYNNLLLFPGTQYSPVIDLPPLDIDSVYMDTLWIREDVSSFYFTLQENETHAKIILFTHPISNDTHDTISFYIDCDGGRMVPGYPKKMLAPGETMTVEYYYNMEGISGIFSHNIFFRYNILHLDKSIPAETIVIKIRGSKK